MKPVESSKEESSEGRLSYDQLNEACSQLYQQNQKLINQIKQMNMTNMFKRLDYLFMVLKYESAIKDADFVGNCVNEIKDALTVPEQPEEKGQEVGE